MAEPAPLQVRDALDELVNQFADPMSFLRELVQNAIDAGSEEVEVTVEREGEGKSGATVIRVDDWGEGMTREIIERRLTRLFSSAKDGDMTKIGKFGIGFVSVFAIDPDAVCVDTSREGETWRVLFDASRRFKLIRRDEPIEGTKVRVIKKANDEEHAKIERRAGEVLRYWCKHVTTDIRYQDELIRQPFEVPDAIVAVDADDGFSKIVVAHRKGPESFAGFYNAGLTLIETKDDALPGIGYKVSSPHLEHTLTRDAVIHDAGYERVMNQVHEMVGGKLCDAVLEQLGSALKSGQGDFAGLLRALSRHAALGHLKSRDEAVVARTPSGKSITWAELSGSHRGDEVLVAHHRSHLTDALERERTVILDPGVFTMTELFATALHSGVQAVAVDERYCLPHAGDTPPDDALRRLGEAVRGLLSADGAKVGEVGFGSFRYPGSRIAKRVAIAMPKLGEPARVAEAVELGHGFLSRARALALNTSHPAMGSLGRLAVHEPEFAAYILVKHFFLGTQLDAALDTRLLEHGLKARWQRSTT